MCRTFTLSITNFTQVVKLNYMLRYAQNTVTLRLESRPFLV